MSPIGTAVRRLLAWTAIACFAGLVCEAAGSEESTSGPVAVDRLIIRYQAGQFELVSRTSMTKTLPSPDELPAGSVQGFWYELQSRDGKIRYRRVIPDPISVVFEGPDPGGPTPSRLQRAETIPAERVFSVLTPRCASGDWLVLFGNPRETKGRSASSEELARIQVLP